MAAQRRKRGGGSIPGGLVAGIATVVVVGLAGKLLQRLNGLNKAKNNNTNAKTAAAKDSVDQAGDNREQESNAVVLKDTSSIPGSYSNPIETPEQASGGFDNNVIPLTVEEFKEGRSSTMSTAGTDISDQHSSSNADSDSREDETQTESIAEMVVSEADVTHEGEARLTNGHTEKIRDDAPEITSRTFGFVSSQAPEKSKSIFITKKLTVDVSWEEKPASYDSESDGAETGDSVAGPDTPVCLVMPRTTTPNVSSTGQSPSQEREMSRLSFGEASEADSVATGEEYEEQDAETEVEDSSGESEELESTDWTRAISFKEFIASIQASASAEIENQVSSDDDSASAVSAKEEETCLPAVESDEDELQEDPEYFPCEDPSVFHKETENGTEDSDSDSVYEDTHEYVEDILDDSNKFSVEAEETAVDSEEIFEESLPYLELDSISTTPSTDVPDAYAQEEVDRAMVSLVMEGNVVTKSDDVTLQTPGTGLVSKEGEDATMTATSSALRPYKKCSPEITTGYGKYHNGTAVNSSNKAKIATITPMEFTSKGENLEMTREKSSTMEMLRGVVLIALTAAMFFMIREHNLKPLICEA